MTEQSSFKSFFGRYLLYKIDQQKANLVLCCILNILTLPLLALAMRKGVFSIYADLYNVGRIGAAICAVFIVFMAIAGAVMSFEFYNKKNLTDTLGVLPITYKQRFFGDLVSGYIANVAPVIPCGVVSLFIFSAAQRDFADMLAKNEITTNYNMMEFGVHEFVTFFFIVSITYFVAVFVTSACGKIRHSFIFSIFALAGLPLMISGFVGFIASSILSVDFVKYMLNTMLLFPPIAPLIDLIKSANLLDKIDNADTLTEKVYVSSKPVYIIVWIALAVIFVVLAYFIGKRRKPENVGNAFVIRPIFNIICALASGGFTAAYLGYSYRNMWFTNVIAVIGGGVVCVVLLLLYLPKIKHLPFGAISGIGAVLAVFGLCVLFDKTGCFGARYLPENAEKIEYVISNDFLKITDKADIEKYMSMQNEVLKKKGNDMMFNAETSTKYSIEYELTNGKTVNRVFYDNYINVGIGNFSKYPTDLMSENEMKLDGYAKYFFETVSEKDYRFSSISVDNGRIDIPGEKANEFVEILRSESEKMYDPEAGVYGYAVFSKNVNFPVQMNFSQSIGYIEGFSDNYVDVSGGERYLVISYRFDKDAYISVRIMNMEKDSELVKELESLLNVYEEGGEFSEDDYDDEFNVYKSGIYISSQCVLKENSSRVLEIMMKMIEKAE